MNRIRKTSLSLVLCWLVTAATAQKVVLVQGAAREVVRDDIARTTQLASLVTTAQTNALQNEFGTMLLLDEQFQFEYAKSGDTSEDAKRYERRTNNLVRGIWLDNTSDPTIEERYNEDGQRELSVSVRGYATSAPMSVMDGVAEVHGCAGFNCPSRNFMEGDALYLLFESLQNGYLAIAVEDPAAGQVYFVQTLNGTVVATGKNQVLKMPDTSPSGSDFEWVMTLENESAMGRHYVWFLFAQEGFSMPYLNKESGAPASLDADAFRKWLRKSILVNDSFRFRQIPITVLAKKGND